MLSGPVFDAAARTIASLSGAGVTRVQPEDLVSAANRVAEERGLSADERSQLRQLLLEKWLQASVRGERGERHPKQ